MEAKSLIFRSTHLKVIELLSFFKNPHKIQNSLVWKSFSPGAHFVLIRPLTDDVSNNDVRYTLILLLKLHEVVSSPK